MRTAAVAILALTLATACGPKTAFLSDRPAQDDDTYYFATLSKRKARKVERLLPPHGLVSRQAESERAWIYFINDPGVGEGIPRFRFQPLTKAEITVRLERHSDIQGLGINAGDVRRQESFTREFKAANMHEAVTLLQALARDPFEAAKKHAPDAWKAVADETQIDALEQGFAIAAHAELVTGNPLDPTSRTTIYTLDARSPRQPVRAKVE